MKKQVRKCYVRVLSCFLALALVFTLPTGAAFSFADDDLPEEADPVIEQETPKKETPKSEPQKKNPSTGDESNFILWSAIMLLAILSIGSLKAYRRR